MSSTFAAAAGTGFLRGAGAGAAAVFLPSIALAFARMSEALDRVSADRRAGAGARRVTGSGAERRTGE